MSRYLLDTNIINNATKAAPSHSLLAWMAEQVDKKAAHMWAGIMANGKAAGRSRSALDTIIAATATANACTVLKDNQEEFDGIETLNPIRSPAPACIGIAIQRDEGQLNG